jgi:hypothetical protein
MFVPEMISFLHDYNDRQEAALFHDIGWHEVAYLQLHNVTRINALGLLLTQNVHPTPNTQQAEQSWLHTRKESRDVPVNFS